MSPRLLRLVTRVLGRRMPPGREEEVIGDRPKDPRTLPAWEKKNMLAKYHVTTAGVERARP